MNLPDNTVNENLFTQELYKRIAAEGKYPPIKE